MQNVVATVDESALIIASRSSPGTISWPSHVKVNAWATPPITSTANNVVVVANNRIRLISLPFRAGRGDRPRCVVQRSHGSKGMQQSTSARWPLLQTSENSVNQKFNFGEFLFHALR